MDRKHLLESALTFVVAALVLSWLAYRFDTTLLERLMPIFRAELNWLMPSFRVDLLDWRIARNETVVVLSATLTEYRVIMNRVFPPGVSINVSTLAAHAWVHPVLILSLCAAWPGIAWKLKPLLLLAALPFVLMAELLDIPLMPWGAMEDFRFFINSTVNFHTMFENSIFQTDGRHHERHHPLRTSSWTEIALVGEIG